MYASSLATPTTPLLFPSTEKTSEKVLRTVSHLSSILYGAAYCAHGVLEAIQGGMSGHIARYIIGVLTAAFGGLTALLSAAFLLYSMRTERLIYGASLPTALFAMLVGNELPVLPALDQASFVLFLAANGLFLLKMINDFVIRQLNSSSPQPTTAPSALQVFCPCVPASAPAPAPAPV